MAMTADSRKRAASEELTPESGPKMPRTSTDNTTDHDGESKSSGQRVAITKRWAAFIDDFLDLIIETDEALAKGLWGVPTQESMTDSQKRHVLFKEIYAHCRGNSKEREVDDHLHAAFSDTADAGCTGVKDDEDEEDVTTGGSTVISLAGQLEEPTVTVETLSPILVPSLGTCDVSHDEAGNSISQHIECTAKVQSCQETGVVASASHNIQSETQVILPDLQDVQPVPSISTTITKQPAKRKNRHKRSAAAAERRQIGKNIAFLVKIVGYIGERFGIRIMQRRSETNVTSNS